MYTRFRGDFISSRLWFQNVVSEDVILCGVSALECLEMFTGYVNEKLIEVYAKQIGCYENISYAIVDGYEGIDCIQIGNVRCTTFEQTVNDMLRDFENTDEMALTEALSNYYFSHGESFNGLQIHPENRRAFECLRESAMQYYSMGQ